MSERAAVKTNSETAPPRAASNATASLRAPPLGGNLAMQHWLRGGLVKPKLEIGGVDDPEEHAADRTAERIMSGQSAAPCSCGDCPQCRARAATLRRKPEASSTGEGHAAVAALGLRAGTGGPLDAAARAFFEPRFGRDLGDVRVHDDAIADSQARVLGARAFAVGSDIVFRRGGYDPASEPGRRLLAHELAHVAAREADPVLRRAVDGATPDASASVPATAGSQPALATPVWIVEDAAETVGPGQMKKSDFLAELRTAICQAAATALVGTPWSEKGCPYIERWFGFYQLQDAQHVERAAQKFAASAEPATTARDYIPAILAKVRSTTRTWIATGQITGLPEGVPAMPPEMPGAGAMPAPPAAAGVPTQPAGAGSIMAKARDHLLRRGGDPQAIRAKLGGGRPLEGNLRSRVEAALGGDFAQARVHTDAAAGRLSTDLNARAFTVGDQIAFAPGEYRPGTPIGDALIAHELAHVAQQQGGGSLPSAPQPESGVSQAALENDADLAAARAVVKMHGRTQDAALLPELRPIMMRSGLRLSRCSTEQKVPTDLTTVAAKADWIRATLHGSADNFEPLPGHIFGRSKGQAIVDVLATLSTAEFIDIQSQLNMSELLDELNDFEAVRMGTLGPVQGEVRNRLNRTRAGYLARMTRDRQPEQGQVVALWMFGSMYGDDIQDVLTLLGADQSLRDTVDQMPDVLALFKQRGIDRNKFHDRHWKASDLASGPFNVAKSFLGSSEAAKSSRGQEYLFSDLELPEVYQKGMRETMNAQFERALTPRNLVLGELDYLAFNIPSSAVGLVSGTISGIEDVSQGYVRSGTEKLTGSAIFVVSVALGVRAFKGARTAAMLDMTPEGQAALVRLRGSIGQAGIDRVAKYVQANSEAAFLVREQGVAGIEALEKAGGDVAKARAALTPPRPTPAEVPPTTAPPATVPPAITPKTPPPEPLALANATTTDIANLKDEGFVFERNTPDGRTAVYRNPTTGQRAVVTLRRGGPQWLKPGWGRNRVESELRDRGFSLRSPTRGEGGLWYRNPATGEEIRIMPRPSEVFRDEAIEKHLNDNYYRYRPNGNVEWGDWTTIPDKD
jgi:Domain of unknown function (DUF4157)